MDRIRYLFFPFFVDSLTGPFEAGVILILCLFVAIAIPTFLSIIDFLNEHLANVCVSIWFFFLFRWFSLHVERRVSGCWSM